MTKLVRDKIPVKTELADVLEVIDAISKLKKYNLKSIEEIKNKKLDLSALYRHTINNQCR